MPKENSKEIPDQFPVVGIGASAGGLEAVKLFLKELPKVTGMAYVFVQHLSPTHESLLPEILKKISPIPVSEITDSIKLKPDNLYIIPENKVLTATDGMLKLSPLDRQHTKSNTIDLFFSSLGSVHQSYAIGIILSGSLSDGTVGLQVIRSYGGLTFAQDEDSAAFESMPHNAAKAGVVDFVLPPGEIAKKLVSINHPFHSGYSKNDDNQKDLQDDADTFKQILTVLRVRRGVDFQYYKSSTLKRRIIRRMALIKIEKPVDYLYVLRENKVEQDALYNDMLISVTGFFRDPQSFNVLCNSLFPALLRRKSPNEPLRIWIAGCATGEEAYSMAICLHEQLGDGISAMKVQIFATDISEIAIAKARIGVYKPNELEGLSTSRIAQFFTKQDGSYRLNKEVRDMCVFAHHNLLKDPPFSKMDLISCRNVLIYFGAVLQKRALSTFNYALNEGGYLMLGKSETVGTNTDLFAPYELGEKLYIKKNSVGRIAAPPTTGSENTFQIDKNTLKEPAEKDVFKLADEALLDNFMPAAVLINDKFDIIQFKGTTDTYLALPPGKPSFNILKMARNGLAFELRNLLQSAKKSNVHTRKFGAYFKMNDLQHFVNLHVMPITYASEQFYLVVFHAASSTGIEPGMFEITATGNETNYNAAELRIEHLERELIQSRADMRVIAEEQESANEELQSANEELLSSSEELQSLNEELETSKEELQSTNEEIIIVNKELIDRNEQLFNARKYADAIVSTVRDPLIIMDKDLRIRRATESFYKKFKLTEAETEEQLFFELSAKEFDLPKLRELLEGILPKKKYTGDLEIESEFKSAGQLTLCLNARQLDNIDGEKLILLCLEDITDKRQVERNLADAKKPAKRAGY